MILQALCRYHDILKNDDQVALPESGYSVAGVSFVLVLSADGHLTNIIDLRTDGKKPIPRQMPVPFQKVRSSGVAPYILCDNSKYIFGVEGKKEDAKKRGSKSESHNSPYEEGDETKINNVTPRTLKCFKEFKSLHHALFDDLDLDATRSLLTFLDSWDPNGFNSHPKIAQYRDDILAGGNLIFEFGGRFLHEHPEIRQKLANDSGSNEEVGNNLLVQQCLVTGQVEPISRLHPKIKGVYGAQPSGASIVSFNDDAFCSYGKRQNFNAPIGNSSAVKYTSVLNHLLDRDSKNKIQLGNTTIVFWAETKDDQYLDLATFLLNPPNLKGSGGKDDSDEFVSKVDPKTVQLIGDILNKVKVGMPLSQTELGVDSEKTNFYMLALSPNASRLSVRFWYQDSVGHFIERLAQHHLDMEIFRGERDPPFVPIYRILKETVPKNSKDKASSPMLDGALMRAILDNSPYPLELYAAILSRAKTDGTINYARAAFLKAYLVRSQMQKTKGKEGWITVGLNEESLNIPYRLGRLFAVLEKAQKDAINGAKSGINSKYFSSASTTPSVVFPALLKLAQHHISKSDWGVKTSQSIEEIMSGIDHFPKYLNLEDQGMFMIGYYHQQKELYKKKGSNGEKEESA
ncbi:type I-C CRISPR-associated protein Cas8c/Csd1 [Methanomassiliicoccus luminyensis]|uniref:type I-C CRISPR-associated protein Cas8c/Csd1 n=1 Tax=Methanomassiliicoccus luminyensis TaxID=1080712 RepID=UPI00035E1946|nr:type I-C CRISPR-associated protein Cas8c/Csd1 [Methanomassiliicoccus luminyensis]